MAFGQYYETEYSACVFQSARCKYQKLRHNVLEITQWPKVMCAHTHAANEGEPRMEHGQRKQSRDEAEYSASLAFAQQTFMVAVREGSPESPSHWLELHPQSMRSWALAPLAILLGLEPPHPQERADTCLQDGRLSAGVIYVGQGHHSHRLPTTCWRSPFVAGYDCAPDEVMPVYIDHIKRKFRKSCAH